MNTTQSSNNGTRLSLDIRDLPQTPFGMKSPRLSSKTKKLHQGGSAGKLSRRTQRKLMETSEEGKAGSFESSKGYWGNPKNALPSWLKPISFQDSPLKKERHVFVKIPEVEEHESDDDVVDIITAGDVDSHDKVTHPISTGPTSGSGTVRANFRGGNRKSRNSLLTDIDEDGSFIEFCHVPKVQPVVQKHVAEGQLYYTCDSQNESNFSTSTKLQQAPVGLRKYIDAVEKIDYLGVISNERHDILPGVPVTNRTPVMYPTEDSVLTGDSQFQSPGKPVLHQVINSTFAEFSNRKNQPVCRMSLQDVSSITTGCEIVLSSSSSSSSPVASPPYVKKLPAPKATDTVIVLDSSDDEKGHKSTEDFEPKDTVTVRRKRSNNRKIRNDTIHDESLSLVLQMENITVQEESPKEAVRKNSSLLEKSSLNVRDRNASLPMEATAVPLSDPETTFHLSVSQQVLRNFNSYLPGKETTPKEYPLQEFLKATKQKNTTVSPAVSNGEVSPVAQWIMTSPFKTIQLSSKASTSQYDDRDTLLLSQDSCITNDHEQEEIREKEFDNRDTLLLSQDSCITNDHEQEEIREKELENNKTVVTIGRIAKNETNDLAETRKSPHLNLCKGLPLQSSEKNVLRSDSEPLPVHKGTKIAGTPLDKGEDLDPDDTNSLMDKSRKGDGQSTSAETTFFNPNVDGQEYISLYQASTVNLTQLQKELDKINNSEWRTYKSSVLESTKISAKGKVQRKYVSSSSEEEGGLVESSKDLGDSQVLRLHLTGKTESHPLMTDDESDEVEEEECFMKRNKSGKLKRNTIESSGDETRCDEVEEESLYIKRTLSGETRKIVVESSDDEIESHEVEEENLYPNRTESDKNAVTIRRKKSNSQRIRTNMLSDKSLPLELQIENITIQEKSPKKSIQHYPDILERNSHNISEHASVLIEEANTVLLSDPETTIHEGVSQQVYPTSCLPWKEMAPKEKSPLEFLKAAGRKNTVSQASTVNGTQLQEELDRICGIEWKKSKSSVLESTKVSATGKVQRKYVSSSSEEEGGLAESSKDLCNSQNLRLHFTDKTESHPLMTDDESDEVEEEGSFIKRSKYVKLKRNVLVSSDGGTSCDEVEESRFCIKTTKLDKPREIVVESSDDESECCEVEESSLHIKRTEPDKLRRIVVESSDDDVNCRKTEEGSPCIKVTKSQKPQKVVIGPSDDETRCSELEEDHCVIKKTKAEKSRKIVIESSDDETKYSEAEEDSLFVTKTKPEKTRNIVAESPDDGVETSHWSEIRAHLSRPERKLKKVFISESGSDSEEDVFRENKSTKSNVTDTHQSDSDDSSFYLPPLSKRLNVHQPRFRSTELGSISGELNIQKPKALPPLPGSFTERQPPRETIILTSDSDDEYCSPKPTKPKTQIIVKPKPPVMTETNHTPIAKPVKPSAVTEPRLHPKMKNKFNTVYADSSSQHTPTMTFLSSLSAYVDPHRCHPEARPYLKNFKKCKEDLVQKLYSYYNNHVFENKLPADMKIEWNARMRKTAGFCYYQIDRSKPSGRGARLELSSKVIDAPERLRDTLIHEMCHAAAWIITGYKDGHGPLWKAWSAKAMHSFPELPAISRCHSYEIACKYTYKCTQCGYSIGRHSKSLDTEKKVCGHCRGRFQLIVNSKPTPVSTHKKIPNSASQPPPQPTPKTPRTPNAFALFVKANYGSLRKVKSSHGEVMKALSAEFSKLKTNHT